MPWPVSPNHWKELFALLTIFSSLYLSLVSWPGGWWRHYEEIQGETNFFPKSRGAVTRNINFPSHLQRNQGSILKKEWWGWLKMWHSWRTEIATRHQEGRCRYRWCGLPGLCWLLSTMFCYPLVALQGFVLSSFYSFIKFPASFLNCIEKPRSASGGFCFLQFQSSSMIIMERQLWLLFMFFPFFFFSLSFCLHEVSFGLEL